MAPGAIAGGAGLPGLVTRLPRPGHGVEAPEDPAGARVQAAHVAAGAAGVAVAHQAPRHDHVSAHGDRRGQAVLRLRESRPPCPRAGRPSPRSPKPGSGCAGLGVHAPQPSLDVAEVEEPLLPVGPGRHAPVHEQVPRHLLVDDRVEDPELLARVRVEGEEPAHGRRDVEDAADHEGRGRERRARGQILAVAPVSRVEGPRDLQLRHVAAVDLGQGGVARGAGVAARMRPVLGRGENRARQAGQGHRRGGERVRDHRRDLRELARIVQVRPPGARQGRCPGPFGKGASRRDRTCRTSSGSG